MSKKIASGITCGCLGCLALIIIVAVLFFLGIGGAVLGGLRHSEPATMALDRADRHPAVRQALGEPVEAGFWVTGSIHVSNGGGQAELSLPLSGPHGTGTLELTANRQGGTWILTTLRFTGLSGPPVDLLDGGNTPPPEREDPSAGV